ncbi:uncharacterized protein LOC134260308 [Saccostrea cucullata]|uniref:uncharacterized protein LOC134260308 n=1 Tax=Saccostrea cuccullata TaxID=36930 RepID=UPI002ED0E103
MEINIFLIVSCLSGLILSTDITWISSLKIWAILGQRVSTEDDVVRNNTWLGKAKYKLTWGVVILQILRIEENEKCSDCGTSGKLCQFCMSPVQLNESSSSFEELRTKLAPGQKYTMGDSWSGIVKNSKLSVIIYLGENDNEGTTMSVAFSHEIIGDANSTLILN